MDEYREAIITLNEEKILDINIGDIIEQVESKVELATEYQSKLSDEIYELEGIKDNMDNASSDLNATLTALHSIESCIEEVDDAISQAEAKEIYV